MGRKMNDLVNAMVEAVEKATKKRTSGYDTSATVKRIEGNTAWVHIPGGVDETPVKLTVSSKVGDTVQVRVSGGKAFIVGNATAPPTDDTTAIVSRTIAKTAKETADTAQSLAEGTREHFWHDDDGAHVLGNASGYRNDIDSTGMKIVDTSDETSVAEFGAGGAVIGRVGTQRTLIDADSFQILDEQDTQQFRVSAEGATKTETKHAGISVQYYQDQRNMTYAIPVGTAISYTITVHDSGIIQVASGSATIAVGDIYSGQYQGQPFAVSVNATNEHQTEIVFSKSVPRFMQFSFEWISTFNVPLIETIGDCSVGNDFYVDSTKLIDFVIEQGKVVDTNWRYRKWKSGFKEAWHEGNVTASATTAVTIGGNTVQYKSTWSLDIPNTIFNDAPIVNIGLGASGQIRFGINGNATSRSAIEGYVFRNTASSTTYNVATSIYAWGY